MFSIIFNNVTSTGFYFILLSATIMTLLRSSLDFILINSATTTTIMSPTSASSVYHLRGSFDFVLINSTIMTLLRSSFDFILLPASTIISPLRGYYSITYFSLYNYVTPTGFIGLLIFFSILLSLSLFYFVFSNLRLYLS